MIGLRPALAPAGASEVVEEVAVVMTEPPPVSVLLPESSVGVAGVTTGELEADTVSPAGDAIGALEPSAEIDCAGELPTPIVASVWTVLLPAALLGAFGVLAGAVTGAGEVETLGTAAGAGGDETTAVVGAEELELSAELGAGVEGADGAGAGTGAGAATGAGAGAATGAGAGAGAGATAGAWLPIVGPAPLGALGAAG
jgi:hypothetical protein